MKRRFSLIAVLVVVLALSAGMFTAYALQNDDVDLTGKWYLWLSPTEYCFLSIFNTNANGYPLLVLKQEGDKLSGTIKGSFGELITKGNIKGRDIEMTGTLPQGVVTFKGKIESGKINGIIDMGIHGSSDFMMARE